MWTGTGPYTDALSHVAHDELVTISSSRSNQHQQKISNSDDITLNLFTSCQINLSFCKYILNPKPTVVWILICAFGRVHPQHAANN